MKLSRLCEREDRRAAFYLEQWMSLFSAGRSVLGVNLGVCMQLGGLMMVDGCYGIELCFRNICT